MVLLTVAPGPDMALVISTSLLRGRAAAIRTTFGISTGTLIWAGLAGLAVGVAHAAIGTVWLILLAVAVDRAGDILRRPRMRRALGGLTGAVLIGFGLRVAAEPGR